MHDDFNKDTKEGNWRKTLYALLKLAENEKENRTFNPVTWMNGVYDVKRIGFQNRDEKRDVLQLCEIALAYTRKILIEVRLHNEARAIYVHQMIFRRWLAFQQKKYISWFLNLSSWFFMGYKKSYAGLIRLAFVTFGVILTFAFLYSFPHQRIEYVPDKYMKMSLSFLHYIYFSGMALTTVGYGDIHPIPTDKIALILSVLEAIIGYVLLGVFVALLVGIDEPVEPPSERDWNETLFKKLQS